MKHKARTKALSWLFSLAMLVGLLPAFSSPALATEGDSTYTITIPSTLTVSGSGWNATGGISATGTLATGKKLTVTASSDGEFALVNQSDNTQKVSYTLATASTDTEATTSWTFDSLSDTATNKAMGIIVEDYSSKPAGTYQDTVTFTAKVENAGIPVSSVAINNAPTEALFVNSTGTLTATVLPDNARDKTVTWSSSDPDYVSINETTGKYTIMGKKGYGSATITATVTNGTEDTSDDVTATCTITGKVHHTSLQAGDIIRVGETIYTDTDATWYVNIKPNTSFATSSGVITLVEADTNGTLYYKFSRGSNGTTPNWTSFKVTDNTDGLYIVSGTGTQSDKFVFNIHTK